MYFNLYILILLLKNGRKVTSQATIKGDVVSTLKVNYATI